MNNLLETLNLTGGKFVDFALPMLIQSSILILILLAVDLLLRKKVRAVFRYWLWMLILVKLVLPPTLSSPAGIGRFFGDKLSIQQSAPVSLAEGSSQTPMQINREESIKIIPPNQSGTEPLSAYTESPAAITPKQTTLPVIEIPQEQISWQGFVFLVWCAVVLAMMLLLIQRVFFVASLIRQAKPANGIMNETLAFCRKKMKVTQHIKLRVSPNATSPAVCGLFRPVILVPNEIGPNLGSGALRQVLMHELAHIKRGDLWINLVQTLLQIVYFYNPLLWLTNACIRRVREQAVDETVQAALGEKAAEYPETLLNVARLAFEKPALSLRFIGVVESKSQLNQRIKKMLTHPIPKSAKLGLTGLMVIIITAAILLPMAKAESDPPSLIIKGRVVDVSGQPIAGAKVFDDGYGNDPDWNKIESGYYEPNLPQWGAITDQNGEYAFLTWPEHHSFKIEADGYKSQRKTLYSGHFTLNKKDVEVFDYALEPLVTEKSEFKAALPNGVTVELVGVCEYPSEGKQWWSPQGTIMYKAPYATTGNKEAHDKEGYQNYELVLRLQPHNASYNWIVPGGHFGSDTGSPKDQSSHQIRELKSYQTGLPTEQQKTNIRFGVTAAPWKTAVTHKPQDDEETYTVEEFAVAFGIPYERDNKLLLPVVHNYNRKKREYAVRVIVVTKTGRIIKSGYSGSGGNKLSSLTYSFRDITLEDVEEFQFQIRPYIL